MEKRVADVVRAVPGNGPEERVEAVVVLVLVDGREPEAVDDPLDLELLVLQALRVGVGQEHRLGEVPERHEVGAERLQRRIGVGGLVERIGVLDRRLLAEHRLPKHCRQALAKGQPLLLVALHDLRGGQLVLEDETRDPAVLERQAIQGIEEPRNALPRELRDGHHL